MLAAFTVNCVASFWLCDLGVLGRSMISGIYGGTFVVTVYFLRTIYCAHYKYDKKHIGDGQGRSKGSGGLSQRMSLSGRRSVTAASQGAFGSSGKKRAEEESGVVEESSPLVAGDGGEAGSEGEKRGVPTPYYDIYYLLFHVLILVLPDHKILVE